MDKWFYIIFAFNLSLFWGMEIFVGRDLATLILVAATLIEFVVIGYLIMVRKKKSKPKGK